MKRQFALGFFLAIVFVACAWGLYSATFGNVELNSKVEWSFLQQVVSEHNDKPHEKLEIVKLDKWSFAGIPVSDGRKKIWIMLDARYSPHYKQIPKGDYRLSADELKEILASGSVYSTVANCLESHVEGVTNGLLPFEFIAR